MFTNSKSTKGQNQPVAYLLRRHAVASQHVGNLVEHADPLGLELLVASQEVHVRQDSTFACLVNRGRHLDKKTKMERENVIGVSLNLNRLWKKIPQRIGEHMRYPLKPPMTMNISKIQNISRAFYFRILCTRRLPHANIIRVPKVQSKSENPQWSAAVQKFHEYERSEVPIFCAHKILWIYSMTEASSNDSPRWQEAQLTRNIAGMLRAGAWITSDCVTLLALNFGSLWKKWAAKRRSKKMWRNCIFTS